MIKALYFLFLLSGAAGLIYESIWTRYLGLFVGHDAYAQIIVLVIFLGGMSAGAMLVSRWTTRLKEPLYGYVAVELVVGCIGLVFHDVINIRHARKAAEANVDGLIAVCAGAGGHAGLLSPFALVP